MGVSHHAPLNECLLVVLVRVQSVHVTTTGECRPIPTTHLVLIYTSGHIGCSIGLETDCLSSMSGLSGTCSTVRRLGTRSLVSLDLVLDESVSQLVLHLDKH